jgi:hypothetical protein
MSKSDELEKLANELNDRTDVLGHELWNLTEWEGEWTGDSVDLGLLIAFEPEVTELSADFRKWMNENELFIRQVRKVEKDNRELLAIVVSLEPSPEGFDEY